METSERSVSQYALRPGERGAALIMVLLISFLLIVAVTSLLLEASMNTANVTDATAEEQAYYAAESGIQSVVNVLRGNTVPNPLIDSSKPADDPINRIDYFKAVRLASSNTPSDTSGVPRLSRWMNYDSTFTDRVVLGDPVGYTVRNGFAYSVSVTDPDNVGSSVTYSTTGYIENPGSPSKTWLGAVPLVDTATITYVPKPVTTLPITSGLEATDFGTFIISATGAGANVPTRTRFAINVNITQPYVTTKVIRGYIETGSITPGAVTAWILYDSQTYVVTGSVINLTGGDIFEDTTPLPPADGGYYRLGYRIYPNAPAVMGGNTVINATMTAPEPIRLLIRSTGFGPHGARKELEAIIHKNHFNGLGAPSPLTLIGPPCTAIPLCLPLESQFIFNPGSSTGTVYSGKDVKLKAFLPPIGLTHDPNLVTVRNRLIAPPPNKYNGKVFGTVSNIADELPFWLQNPRNLHETLTQLKLDAQASGTFYGVSDPRPPYGYPNYGDKTNATGITYIEGDLEFAQDGGGILVVTGTLTFKGGFEFNGLVVVTGPGGILRTGGGSGSLQGNLVVAPYNDWGRTTCMDNVLIPNKLDCFLAPNYDISGGGASEIVYNSNNVGNGLLALTNYVKGVAEK